MDPKLDIFCGPVANLKPYFEDENVTDLLINGVKSIYIDRHGELEQIAEKLDNESLFFLWERLVVYSGKRWNALYPFMDGKLASGHRFHIAGGAVAEEGFQISFRRHLPTNRIASVNFGNENYAWVEKKFLSRENILICGGTGSGKTTLAAKLLSAIPKTERVIILEESKEIPLDHPHAVRMEGRERNPDGVGEISLEVLVRQALRMRPDRLILGECRGKEAMDLMRAWNIGHPGSLTTIHANSGLLALTRLESLVKLADPFTSIESIRMAIAQTRLTTVLVEKNGFQREITEIIEILGVEGSVYRFHPVTTNFRQK